MNYDNSKYTDHLNILARLTRYIKQKEFHPDDVMEWCQEVETDYLGDVDNMFLFLQVPLVVTNYAAKLPCNVHRVIDIYTDPNDNGSIVFANNDGAKLFLGNWYNKDYVYINYYGTPINDQGVPMIIRGHEQACEAYCILKVYYEDILNDKVSTRSAVEMKEEFRNKLNMARRMVFRHMTREDVNKGVIIRHSMITHIGNLALKQKEFE